MSGFVLDASALLTLIEGEAGADRVEEVLRSGSFQLPWLALLEVHYVSRQEKGDDEADRRFALLTQTGGTIVWGMKNLRYRGGEFRLFSLQDFVKDIFGITRLDMAFKIFDTEAEAVSSFQDGGGS